MGLPGGGVRIGEEGASSENPLFKTNGPAVTDDSRIVGGDGSGFSTSNSAWMTGSSSGLRLTLTAGLGSKSSISGFPVRNSS